MLELTALCECFQGAFENSIMITGIFPHFETEIAPLRTPLSKWDLHMPLGILLQFY